MLILDVNKVSKNFGHGCLFEEVSFSLNKGERISIVGANGCGKSTLLKMIAGLEKCDDGTISIKKGVKIAYLDQTSPDKSDDRIVDDVLKDAYADLFKMQNEMDNALGKGNINYYSTLQEQFQNAGGYEVGTNLDIICNGLEIPDGMRSQNYNSLSGGEKTLVHLAKSLLQKPDLFLLDEPTNHLDITRIEWLENYIKNFRGAIVTVSHDRAFLDNMSDKILEIDNGQGTVYSTSYTGYLAEKEKRFEKLMANWEDQQTYFKRLEEQARRMQQAGMATNSTAMTRKAGVMFARLEREKEKFTIKKPIKKNRIKIDFDELRRGGKRAIEIKNLIVTADERKVVDNVNLFIVQGERVAIIGANGSGKSSIIKTILGEQSLPYTGEVTIAPSIKIGYLPQTIDFTNNKEPLLEYFKREISHGEERARSILARFHFSREDVEKRVGNLSGGERIRVRLAVLLQQQINCLIFDEPTNHIDIPTKESLEEALDEFEGTLLFVSHDRFFINKFADRTIVVDKGKISVYLGNFDDYKRDCKRNV